MSDSFSAYSVEPSDEPLLSWRRLTQLALMLACGIVLARSMMIELVRDPFQVAPGQQYTPLGPGPGAVLALNLLALAPALMVLARRVFDREYRLARANAPLALAGLGMLAMVSTAWSDDRFLTVVSATTLFSAGVLCWTVAQVVRSWGRLRFVAALMVGILLVYAAQGLFYRYVELPELQVAVEKSKDRILEERGFEPGSFQAEQFLRRITGGEVVGFGSSPNTYAAVIVMLGLVSAGIVVHGIRTRRDPVLLVVPVGAMALGAWCATYTHSRTALATPALAVVVAGVGLLVGTWAVRWRGPLFAAGLGIVLLGIVAVVGHGLYHGSLPSDSLNFRWRYWVGSWGLFTDHLASGVGYANFGPNYLAYRLPAAAEEIRDPHNFLVRFATELGLAGLVLAVTWQLIMWWEQTRPTLAVVPRSKGLAPGAVALMLTTVLGVGINTLASVDFAADGPFVVIELFKRLMYCGIVIAMGALSLIASRNNTSADDEPSPMLVVAMAAAAAAFLLHNLVDFSLFENGPMFLFALLTGSVIGVRAPRQDEMKAKGWKAGPVGRGMAAVAGAGLLATSLAGIAMLVAPVLRAEARARAGDESLRLAITPPPPGPIGASMPEGQPNPRKISEAARLYQQAYEILPANAEYAYRSARAWIIGRFAIWEIRAMYDAAIKSNPKFILAMLESARFELSLPPTGEAAGNVAKALELFEKAVRLNPTDVGIRLEYAKALERVGQSQKARAQVESALEYNDKLDEAEPKRLQPGELAATQEWLQRLSR